MLPNLNLRHCDVSSVPNSGVAGTIHALAKQSDVLDADKKYAHTEKKSNEHALSESLVRGL